MKFALVGWGARGDIEPLAAVGRELLRRGHDVCMAVPPNMVGFVESVGLSAVAYGRDSQGQNILGLDASGFFEDPTNMLTPILERFSQIWAEKSATLTALANGADVLLAGISEQVLAANVAEFHGIPLAALHCVPEPIFVSRHGELYTLATTEAGEAQRRALDLPEAGLSAEQASPEIQAYEEFCFPTLPAERAEQGGRRPFVGALTLELPTEADDEVLSWIAQGSPPIYFGFGGTQVPAGAIAMIGAACAQLGERALVCAGWSDITHADPHSDHVKIVAELNYGAVFPACRAAVHHGGAGTTAAAMRAGIPTLIFYHHSPDKRWWAASVSNLEVGFGRPSFAATQESLVADLRSILTPHCAARAREVATQMTKPAESAARAADLLEETAKEPR